MKQAERPDAGDRTRQPRFYRDFTNRREVASYSGLILSLWKSGGIDVEQGISKAGNARLRKTMTQLWLWLQDQPGSALRRWIHRRVGDKRSKIRRIIVVALARNLLVALWRYATQGVVPEGVEVSRRERNSTPISEITHRRIGHQGPVGASRPSTLFRSGSRASFAEGCLSVMLWLALRWYGRPVRLSGFGESADRIELISLLLLTEL